MTKPEIKIRRLVLTVLYLCMGIPSVHAFSRADFPLHIDCLIGLAYPQIPLSEFRPPIGITGQIRLVLQLHPKWMVAAGFHGMKTYSLGTVTGRDIPFKFNMTWGSLSIDYRMGGDFGKLNYISAGPGLYSLNRRFDFQKDHVDTPGLHIGYVNRSPHPKFGTVFDIRWHVLFEPNDNPQVLTMTFGIIL
jgi:hypothetical protein